MTTTDWIVLVAVYAFVFIAYCTAVIVEQRACENVRKMDAEYNPDEDFKELVREVKEKMSK